MRAPENYTPFVAIAAGLTIAILAAFQIYIAREPARIAADQTRDRLIAVSAGRALYAQNCAVCHGEQGEGIDGPPLNDRKFLANTPDLTIFSLISSGVPGTEMPAWNQAHGGPFTDEQIRQLVAFIRSWEADAPDRQALAMIPDPVNGLKIFNSTCVVCHGENGQGTDRAPALNDPTKLAQFDDEWYADTIAEGRPAKGMPTWGTVLAPDEIRDIIALFRAWEGGEVIELPGIEEDIAEAMHMLEHGDLHAAEHLLEHIAGSASGEALTAINKAREAIEAGDGAAAEVALTEVLKLLDVEQDHSDQPGNDPHAEDDQH